MIDPERGAVALDSGRRLARGDTSGVTWGRATAAGLRVAVIGSGIAGLSACRALAGRADIDLYEAAPRPGGHVLTVTDPRTGTAVDMGFIVWNREHYPRFGAMLRELGVPSRPSDMAFSVARADGSLEFGSASLDALFAQRRNLLRPAHYRRIAGILRFLTRGRRDLARGAVAGLSLSEYLARRAPAGLAEELIEPIAAALWSMAPDAVADFPAETFLRFLDQHGMLRPIRPLTWWTIEGGSRRYVDALLSRLPIRLHLACPVQAIDRDAAGVTVHSEAGSERYDRVVLAVHADTALALLRRPAPRERAVLGAFRFTANEVVLHTDDSYLPRAPAARASWNYIIPDDRGRVAVTYWMNRLMGLPGSTQYLVTLNPCRPIDAARILRRAVLEHPLFDRATAAAQAALPSIQGCAHSYFCGAWSGYGFHEDGMRSGMAAAARLLADQTSAAAEAVA